ncbi:MAG: hypothetical protein ABI778_01655 [Ignavibacteriota bacterium]
MKVLIIITSLLFAIAAGAQPTQFHVKNFQDPAILRSLFDTKLVKNNVAIWEPNFSEAQEFNVSFDGKCHTSLDTVMKFRADNQEFALLIFATYGFLSATEKEDCHACAPDISLAIFSKDEDGNWIFQRMKKFLMRWGQWGGFDGASLKKIGDNVYAIAFDGGGSGQGYTDAIVEFFELQSFQNIYTVATHSDNNGVGDDAATQYDWDRKVEIIPSKNGKGYYEIVATRSGKGYEKEDDNSSPIVKLAGKETYRFDTALYKYVLVK